MSDRVWVGANSRKCGKEKRYHSDKDCHLLQNTVETTTVDRDYAEKRWSHCQYCSGEYDPKDVEQGKQRRYAELLSEMEVSDADI